MLELEEAQQRILNAVESLGTEPVPLSAALGRFAAADVLSSLHLPPFDNSAMDGYAVRTDDVASASNESPVLLRQIGKVAAGQTFSPQLAPGDCVRVFTGSALPKGSDAVIMQEDTLVDASFAGRVSMRATVRPWDNVRFQGEDLKPGDVLIQAGRQVGIGSLGLLAATGVSTLLVGRRPVLGLLATGSELEEPGRSLQAGHIYESNRICLAALACKAGAEPKVYPLVADNLSQTISALQLALCECDAVVTSGGVSVGEMDFVKAAFHQLGGDLEFWRVAIKPGKPFAFGRCQNKLLFGLPGNPVSAFVTFLLLVRPALLKSQGAQETGLRTSPAILGEPVVNGGDRRHFLRVKRDPKGLVHSSGAQASHLLRSLADADGLVDVPPRTTRSAGELVSVLEWA